MHWVMVIHNEIDTLNVNVQDSMSLAEPPTDSEVLIFVIKPDILRIRAFWGVRLNSELYSEKENFTQNSP